MLSLMLYMMLPLMLLLMLSLMLSLMSSLMFLLMDNNCGSEDRLIKTTTHLVWVVDGRKVILL